MIMSWFIPVTMLIGLAGTRTALKSRHNLKAHARYRYWWLMVALSWTPLVCWVSAQFVTQD
jgi:hypothetical protein